jgi:phosphatidylserine/phosphatidylglycerophosphate/cardiolipin synthase-like enzyme
VPAVASALARATRRGVAVRLVLEDPDISQGKVAFDALHALGPDVAAQSAVYVWPLDQRPKSTAGQHGSLHAKCAVADDRRLLISSANLTEHAFNLNIELGIMVRGGDLPARVVAHWTSLITAHTLRRIAV